MQIPILSGIAASPSADFNETLPVNLEPVVTDSGISKGYLRSMFGADAALQGAGIDRGGTVWNGMHLRVMGASLVQVSDSSVSTLGSVGDGGPVGFARGFSYLAIQSGMALYYWDGTAVTQVTDANLGACLDVAWTNGQYFSTDGTYVVATDIADPMTVLPLEYGSAEADPDAIVGLLPLRDELYVFGTNTIEVQSYVGGSNFPLQANTGATIPVGCVGARAKCYFSQTFAFCGAPPNGQLGVYVAGGGSATKLSTRVVDDMLSAVLDPSVIEMESVVSRDEERLYVHLPDRSLVYLRSASNGAQQAVWYVARSGIGMDRGYRLRHATLFGGKFWVGDTQTAAIGTLSEGPATADGAPALMSMTLDGETWSMERACSTGRLGQRNKRVQWRPHRRFRNYMGLRFRGQTGLAQFGEATGWQFQTQFLYGSGKGGILHSAELVGLPGRGVQGWASLEAEIEALAV